MNSNPRIKRSYSVIGHSNSLVEFRCGGFKAQSFYLIDEDNQRPFFDIVSLFKGEMTVKDIVGKLKVDQKDVEHIIELLKKEDIIEEKPQDVFNYYLDVMKPLTDDQHFCLPKKDVLLVGDEMLCSLVKNLLKPLADRNKINVDYFDRDLFSSFFGGDSDWPLKPLSKSKMVKKCKELKKYFVVFVSRHFNPVIMPRFNFLAHECDLTWMSAMIDGPMLLVGPTINHDTACFGCFENRVLQNVECNENFLDFKMEVSNENFQQSSAPIIKPIENLLASFVALDVTNYILTGTNHTKGKCMSLYLPTMETIYHDIYKCSECATCGLSEQPQENHYFEMENILQEQDNVVYFNKQSNQQTH